MSSPNSVESSAVPFRARAWWGDELVAESTRCLRLEEPGESPALCFPCRDVRFEMLRDEGRTFASPLTGTAGLWSIDEALCRNERATASAAPSAAVWDASRERGDGHDVLRRFTRPSPELLWLSDFAAFDHDRVRVELIDADEGAAPRDVTVKRFPTWGDVSQLIDLLDVQRDGELSFVSTARADQRRPVVEGSQILAQAIVAARRHAPGRRVVSAHMMFLRSADARESIRVQLAEMSVGRTFTALAVEVYQAGRRCAAGTLLMDETSPDLVRHAPSPPEVVGPYESDPCDMGLTGRDIRVVDGAYTADPNAPVGPPILDSWVRFRRIGDDPDIHAGLLAQFTGHLSIAAALRPHHGVGQYQAHRTLSMAINAIAISFHREVRVDRWLLYHHLSTFAGDGMTHSECRVHGEDGDLLASFTVEAMVRGFPDGKAAQDDRTAL
jgi:acyl-CoA thioesterase II